MVAELANDMVCDNCWRVGRGCRHGLLSLNGGSFAKAFFPRIQRHNEEGAAALPSASRNLRGLQVQVGAM
jgi:hypothetical protein